MPDRRRPRRSRPCPASARRAAPARTARRPRSASSQRRRAPRARRRRRPAASASRRAPLEDAAVGRVVVDDQHAQVARASRTASPRALAGGACLRRPKRAVKWKVLPRPGFALDPSAPAHQLDEPRRDGQPQAGAAVRAASSSRRPARTASKIARCLSGGMPMPVSRTATSQASLVAGCRLTPSDAAPRPRRSSVNLMALPTRLTRICRSRPGSPTRASGTSGGDVAGQLQALLVRPGGERLHRVAQRVAQAEVDRLELELARLDLGEVEDVVDAGAAASPPSALTVLQVLALLRA